MTRRSLLILLTLSLWLTSPPKSRAALVYTTSSFNNFTITQNDAIGFAATADIFEGGVKAGVLNASVVYGGGSNPFNSGSLWGVGNFFRATGQSTNTGNVAETAGGIWNFSVAPEVGWQVDGMTLFTLSLIHI